MIDHVKIFFACNLVTVQNLVVSDTVLMHVGTPKILQTSEDTSNPVYKL